MSINWKRLPCIVFDTETTGFGPEARIVEIATLERVWGLSTTLINPGDVDWEHPDVVQAMSINGIDIELLEGFPTFARQWERLRVVFEASDVWAGHHVGFDVRMVQQELQRMGQKLVTPALLLDTVVLDHALNPGCESYRLSEVIKRWNVPELHAHRALGDTKMCRLVLKAMMPKLPNDLEEMKQVHAEWEEKWKERKRQRDEQRRQEEQKP